jgi:hypothetical protein
MNEKKWNVDLRDGFLHVVSPGRKRAKIRLTDVIGIAIETNDSGPWGSDVIWHVSDGDFTLHFPMGATGEPEILDVFQRLPGFDNQEMIDAMSSTRNEIFVVYRKEK